MAGEPNIERIHGEVLQMRSITFPEAMNNMSPGDSATWIVDVWAEATELGDIEVRLSADGTLAETNGDFLVLVTSCPLQGKESIETACPSPNQTKLPPFNAAELGLLTEGLELSSFPTEQARRFLITGSLDQSGRQSFEGKHATLTLTATGAGDSLTTDPESPSPPEQLPKTGPSRWLPYVSGVAFLLLSIGVVLFHNGRKRNEK